jgi:hypothetical protein
MNDSPVSTETSSRHRVGRKHRCDAECRPLAEELIRHGTSKWQASTLAIKLWNSFGTRAYGALQLFLANGWGVDALTYCIRIKATVWRKCPRLLFEAEQRLERAGLPKEVAHACVLRFERAVLFKEEDVRNALVCYRNVGVSEPTIRLFGERRPRALIAPPETIRVWAKKYPGQNRRIARLSELYRTPLPSLDDYLRSIDPEDIPEIAVAGSVEKPPPDTDSTTEEVAEDDDDNVPCNWKKYVPRIIEKSGLLQENGSAKDLSSCAWIWDGSSPGASAVLQELSIWASFPKIGDAGSSMPVVRFLAKLCLETKLQAFFRLKVEVVRYRIATLRRFILPCDACGRKDFIETPGLLLLPWETVQRNEIHYRSNSLSGLPKTPCHRLTAPLFFVSRAEFVAEMERLRHDTPAA